MIKEIRLKNFYSFSECTIPLNGDVNVLIGINGSGKSNLLKAITLLKEGVAGVGLRKHVIDALGGFENIFFKGAAAPGPIELEFRLDKLSIGRFGMAFKEDVIYTISLLKDPGSSNYYVHEKIMGEKGRLYLKFDHGEGVIVEQAGTDNAVRNITFLHFVEPTELALSKIFDTDRFLALSTLRKAINEVVVYTFFDTAASSAIRKPILPTSEKILLPDGGNLPQILNTIKINHKKSFQKIIEKLNEVNPRFKGIDFNFIGGNIELMLEESTFNSSVHVSNISDGTLRYLCLLAILYNPDRGALICIDEPEVGLHPDMISTITNAVFDASQKSSLIIPTHSDRFLNHFEVEHVRVFERNEENASVALIYSKDEFKGWYEKFSLGDMWRAGDIGGNRW